MELTVRQLMEDHGATLGLTPVAGIQALSRPILSTGVDRPAILVAGVAGARKGSIQVLGAAEIDHLLELDAAVRRERLSQLPWGAVPCVVVADGREAPKDLVSFCEREAVPCLTTSRAVVHVMGALAAYVAGLVSQSRTVQGGLMDVGGLGTLILGEPGVGKSEAALELVARGHRLVADDVVEIRQTQEGDLVGRAPSLIGHHMEIRGLGIIDVQRLFGTRAIRHEVPIQLVIELVRWDKVLDADRSGLEEDEIDFLGTRLPRKTLPVSAGRNMAVVIEVACLNERLKTMGIHVAREFDDRVRMEIAKKEEKSRER